MRLKKNFIFLKKARLNHLILHKAYKMYKKHHKYKQNFRVKNILLRTKFHKIFTKIL